jgi:flagellar assembly factor FliW
VTSPAGHERIVTFEDGLPGFEASRRFVLVGSPDLDPFTLVQGVGADAPSFVAIEPRRVDRDYETALNRSELRRLGAQEGRPLLWLALVASQPDGSATVNLRAPIIIDPESMRGIQLLPDDSAYRMDHPLLLG